MSFTAYAQLSLPQVAEAFTHLGFPDYFRVELSWAKLLGVVLLLAPVPARLKEWAYAGFAITLASALIAHFSVGDGPEAWGWAAATSVLWGLSVISSGAGCRPRSRCESQRTSASECGIRGSRSREQPPGIPGPHPNTASWVSGRGARAGRCRPLSRDR